MGLTAKQRQFLKGLAHPLSPVVRVGKGGVSTSVIEETKKSLDAHELIKVRIESDDSASREVLVTTLADATGSEVAGRVGKIAILYRARDEKPTIELPK
ncbi:MAG TPA: ribosome assembly RNA-binding protein YhbY [Thermoanaerobaculia bacterium]|nr:ribosome assembly RNA-binding protein YhbY [Thermoanaerobaculia bacterium]